MVNKYIILKQVGAGSKNISGYVRVYGSYADLSLKCEVGGSNIQNNQNEKFLYALGEDNNGFKSVCAGKLSLENRKAVLYSKVDYNNAFNSRFEINSFSNYIIVEKSNSEDFSFLLHGGSRDLGDWMGKFKWNQKKIRSSLKQTKPLFIEKTKPVNSTVSLKEDVKDKKDDLNQPDKVKDNQAEHQPKDFKEEGLYSGQNKEVKLPEHAAKKNQIELIKEQNIKERLTTDSNATEHNEKDNEPQEQPEAYKEKERQASLGTHTLDRKEKYLGGFSPDGLINGLVAPDTEKLENKLNEKFEKFYPFKVKKKDYKFWKIDAPVFLNNIFYESNISAPCLLSPQAMLAFFKYSFLLLGIFSEESSSSCLVFGVPAQNSDLTQPFYKECIFVESREETGKDIGGYWIVYINPKTGELIKVEKNQE